MADVTDVNTESQDTSANGGLPLRGFAMVLIAVAILLGLWGLYALTRDDSDPSTTTGANGTATAPAEPGDDAAAGDGGVGVTPGAPPGQDAGTEEPDEAGDRPDGEAPEAVDGGEDGTRDADRRDRSGERGSSAPAAARPAPAPERLHVLNNSTVPNLAAEVSETLSREGHELGEVGNLPDDVEVLPENTVFFQPGNAAAEERARKLADRVDGVAREHIPSLPEETAGPNDLTLVLVGQVALQG